MINASTAACADQKIRECKASGFDSVANAWRLIREVIRDVQESDADLRAGPDAE